MKLFLIAAMLISTNIIASRVLLDGRDLERTSHLALEQALMEINEEELFAFETRLFSPSETSTKLITREDIRLEYGCHFHGTELVCHEELYEQGERTYPHAFSVSIDTMKKAQSLAVQKFDQFLRNYRRHFGYATRLKIWSQKLDNKINILIRIVFDLSFRGQNRVVYYSCPVIQESTSSCHQVKNVNNEPVFDFGGDGHDHDH